MKPFRLSLLLAPLLLAACATTPASARSHATTASESIVLREDLQLHPLADGVWRHVSTEEVPGFGTVPSNGLLVQGESGALLVDTPWTPEQTRAVLAWAQSELGQPVLDVIVTHSHRDRTGGVAALPPGVRIHALPATAELSAADGRPFAATALPPEATLELPGGTVHTFFPGAGHTSDNLVVWLPAHRILHGGCFVKDATANHLGNVADADPSSWSGAVERVRARFPAPAIVVPGHGAPGGPELLDHTAALVEAARPQTHSP